MDALILAAGRGTRMKGIDTPKCLLELNGIALIDYQIKCFKQFGINQIFVVTGYNSDLIRSHLKDEVIFIQNPDFVNSNNITSVWSAKEFLNADFICVYGDLLFDKEILQNLIQQTHDVCMVVEKNVRYETMKVKIENNHIIQVNKKIPESEADGNFIGMAKFSKNIISELFNGISNCLTIDKNSYYTSAIELLINNGQFVNYLFTNNLQWMDIDEPNEFAEAKILFNQLENEK